MLLGAGDEFGQAMEIFSDFKDLPILVLTSLPKETGKPNSGRHFTMKCTPQEKMATYLLSSPHCFLDSGFKSCP